MRIPFHILVNFIDVPAVISSLQMKVAYVTGDNIVCYCTLPGHNDSKPSLSIDKYDGKWSCFGCRQGGSLLKLIELTTGLLFPESLYYAKRFLDQKSYSQDKVLDYICDEMNNISEKHKSNRSLSSLDSIQRTRLKEENIKPVYFPVGTYVWTSEVYAWCVSKNIDANKVKPYFNIGYCNLGQYRNRVIIPIIFGNKFVDFQARDVTGDQDKKDLYIKGIPVSNFLFNYDNINWNYPVGIVEGSVDVLRLWPYSTNVVGAMGAFLGDKQAELLKNAVGIYAMPDPDTGGVTLLNSIKEKLYNKPMWLRYFDKNNLGGIVSRLKRLN